MLKIGFKIPTSSKAYVPIGEELEGDYQTLLTQILINDAEATYLVRETKQTKLEF